MNYKWLLLIACLVMTALVAPTTSAGTERHECFGKKATIVGTRGADRLIGRENKADVIVGLGGHDIIAGSRDINSATAPGDRLCEDPGQDHIRGGVGEDRIQGGGNRDDVDGSFGYDVITQGGRGRDRVYDCDSEYSGGVRIIKGGRGRDRLCVDTDRTRMYGEGGADTLIDFSCNEESELLGGTGHDEIESYHDNQGGEDCPSGQFDVGDLVVGGPGQDQATVSANDRTNGVETVNNP